MTTAARALFRDYGMGVGGPSERTFTFYASAGATTPADVQTATGGPLPGGTVAGGRRAPDVYGPAGANELWVDDGAGYRRPMLRQGPPVVATVDTTPSKSEVVELIQAAVSGADISAPTTPTTTGITQADLDAAVSVLQDKATAATDTELASAVATLNAALGGKQDAGTAATDAELASAVATINASLGGKQDAGTAATDAELAAGLAGKQDAATAATDAELASGLVLKQDAATAATDAELASAVATLNAALAAKGDASAVTTETSRAQAAEALKQDAATDPGSVIASAVLSATYVLTVGWAAVPGWQIVVPANSGIVDVEVAEPMLVNINTGTNAAGTKFSLQMRITDEAGAVVAYSQKAIFSSAAVSQVWADVISLKKQVPNNPAAKTYKVEALMDHVGIAGGASSLFTSQSGFTDPTLRAVRR